MGLTKKSIALVQPLVYVRVSLSAVVPASVVTIQIKRAISQYRDTQSSKYGFFMSRYSKIA